MDGLTTLVRQVVSEYAGEALNGYSYLTQSNDGRIFSITSVGHVKDRPVTFASLFVRIVGEQIIIECDQNDKPLVDALKQTGIPRSQIILAYAGEASPESA